MASSGQQMLAGEVQEMLEDSLQGFRKVQGSRKECEGRRGKEWNPTGGPVGGQRHMGTHMGQGDRQRRQIGDR